MKITVLDEINCLIEGLPDKTLELLINKFKYVVAGSFATSGVKLGIWDGKEALITDDGYTFVYLMEDILDFLELLGVDINEFEFEDNRTWDMPDIELVDDQYLIEETGMSLRSHQVDAINSVIAEGKGYIDAATSAGKTLICLGISKAFDPYLKSVIIVPSVTLARQTYKDYKQSDLSVVIMDPKIPTDLREQAIAEHRHIIITEKLFLNCVEFFSGSNWVVMKDEVHRFGDVLLDAFRCDISTFPIRIGLTGTFPKDKLKATKIKAHLGGGQLTKVSADYLQTHGYASVVDITMYTTTHASHEELFSDLEDTDHYDWSIEDDYNSFNKNRIAAIAEFIDTLPKENTLILCHPRLGESLAELLECPCITDKVDADERDIMLRNFVDKDDFRITASFGTSGTGLSINRIFRLITIDVGKNEVYIMQGIGRGMRLADDKNGIPVIDISSNMKYGKRHRDERIKIYKREKYKFTQIHEPIVVLGSD